MATTPENNANAVTPLSRADLEAVIQKTPFAQMMGAQLEEYGDGVANVTVALRTDMTMHMGFAHGAIIGFMADSACAWAAASMVGNVVTSEYKLNLIAPGIGEQLRAEGKVLKAAGRNVVCMANVYALNQGNPTLVAVALATITRFGRS